MPGTHFATEWMCGPCLPVPKVGLEPVTLELPVSCSTIWNIGSDDIIEVKIASVPDNSNQEEWKR